MLQCYVFFERKKHMGNSIATPKMEILLKCICIINPFYSILFRGRPHDCCCTTWRKKLQGHFCKKQSNKSSKMVEYTNLPRKFQLHISFSGFFPGALAPTIQPHFPHVKFSRLGTGLYAEEPAAMLENFLGARKGADGPMGWTLWDDTWVGEVENQQDFGVQVLLSFFFPLLFLVFWGPWKKRGIQVLLKRNEMGILNSFSRGWWGVYECRVEHYWDYD